MFIYGLDETTEEKQRRLERKRRMEYLDERINMKLEQVSVLEDKIKALNEFLLVAVRANGMFKQLEELRNEIVSQK